MAEAKTVYRNGPTLNSQATRGNFFDLVRIKERRFQTAVFVVATALCRRKTLRRC
jgi:hypothetical protein